MGYPFNYNVYKEKKINEHILSYPGFSGGNGNPIGGKNGSCTKRQKAGN
jgi:hypothetical protein